MLGHRHVARPLDSPLDEKNQLNREDSFHLDNPLDSEVSFDSKFLLDFEDPSDLDDVEDLFDLRISDLHWNEDQLPFHL